MVQVNKITMNMESPETIRERMAMSINLKQQKAFITPY